MSDEAPTIPARDHRELSFAVPCGSCEAWTERRLGPRGSQLPDHVSCGTCGVPQPLQLTEHVDADGALDGCPRCGYHTLCIQKDVNPRLGVIVVTVTYVIILALRLDLTTTLITLGVLTVVDLLALRLLVKRLLICYRCKAQFRGFLPGPMCRPFDLSTWEAHTPPKNG